MVLCVVFYTFLGKTCNWFICIIFLKKPGFCVSAIRFGNEGGNTLEVRVSCCHQRSIKLSEVTAVFVFWGHQTLELPCSCMEARNASHTVWNHTEEVILSPALQEFGNSGSLVPGDGARRTHRRVCMAMSSTPPPHPLSHLGVFSSMCQSVVSQYHAWWVSCPLSPPTTQRQDRALGFAFRLPCAGLWHEVFLFPFVST